MYQKCVKITFFGADNFGIFFPSSPSSSLHLSLLVETNESRDFKITLNPNYTNQK